VLAPIGVTRDEAEHASRLRAPYYKEVRQIIESNDKYPDIALFSDFL
jgi:hypothetical protein